MARVAYKNAYEAGDQDKLLQAQEMLNEAQVDLKSVNVTKEKFKQAPQQPVQQQQYQQPVAQQAPDPRAQEWARTNAWFNKDPVMTEGAKVIHRQLTEIEGYDPNSEPDDYYKEIDRRIRLEFPHKFDTTASTETAKPTQTVASATSSSKTSGRKIVKLTP